MATRDVDAAVRFDFHPEDYACWTNPADWDIKPPEVTGGPGAVGPDYGYSRITFILYLGTDRAQALRMQSQLARELLRDDNYLHFQLGPDTPPRWWHVYRSSPGALGNLEWLRTDGGEETWALSVGLDADSFAEGELVTIPLTVGNDPGTGGLVTALPDIQGDAPAPLTVSIAPGSTTYAQPLLTVAAIDAPSWPGGTVWQAETWTVGTNTTAPAVSDASGGSAARFAIPLGGTTNARRVTGNVTVPYAGRWRLFVRAMLKGNWTTWSVTTVATITGTGAACAEPVVTQMLGNAAAAGSARLVELGTYVFPKGNMPSSRPYTLSTAEVGIDASAVAGATLTVTLDFDYVVAIPLDLPLDQAQPPRTLEFTRQSATAGDATLRLDAEAEAVQEIRSNAFGVAAPEVPVGGFPQVVPGATNVLYFMPRRGSATTDGYYRDALSDSTTLTLTYRARYLYLGVG